MKPDKQKQQVAEADAAVNHYLEALLKDVETYVPPVDERVLDTTEVSVEIEQDQQCHTEVTVVDSVEQDAVVQEIEGIVPAWADHPFQCLMFKLNGITMSIPLTSLLTIIEWEQEATVIPGQPDWHLGVLLNRDAKVGIVDTARIVMPERLSERLHGERQTGGYILVVGDGRWGLACDSIASTVTLSNEMVRWRTGTGKRPWLAGTVREQLCALVDVDSLLGMINA